MQGRSMSVRASSHADSAFLVQVLVLTATLAAAGYLMCLRASGLASPALIGLLVLVWAAGFPLGILLEAAIPLPTLPEDARRVFGNANVLIEEQRQETNRCAETLPISWPSQAFYTRTIRE